MTNPVLPLLKVDILTKITFKTYFLTANFTLPEEESETLVPIFVETTFVELEREAAKEVVDLYNKIAKEKGYGKKHEERKTKKFRGQNRGNFRARGSGPFVA